MQIIFFLLAATALISGIMVVIQVNPVRSALFLVLNFFALAGIYLLANAQFIAAIQIIVYAGAIMVLFLFVIMLLNLRQPEEGGAQQHLGQKIFGATLAGGTAALVIYTISKIKLPPGKEMVEGFGTTEMVAKSLFTEYLLPFEATSILLLVAVVGAVILAKSRLD
ncbi:MAG: NADH-quinone oxidoreductase subunit J [Deltaproteobacteria bacterium]|nr:NADH-quinone oxidoreductase subunit J [Deltaproteobacteria bacterium]